MALQNGHAPSPSPDPHPEMAEGHKWDERLTSRQTVTDYSIY